MVGPVPELHREPSGPRFRTPALPFRAIHRRSPDKSCPQGREEIGECQAICCETRGLGTATLSPTRLFRDGSLFRGYSSVLRSKRVREKVSRKLGTGVIARLGGLVILAGLATGFLLVLAASPAQAGWVLPSNTISSPSSTTYNPKVGIGPGGATTVVWQVDDNFDDIIQAITRPNSTGSFGAPVTLFQQNFVNNIIPEIAIGPKGATDVVWTSQSGSFSNATYSGRPGNTGPFSGPVAMDLGANDELPYPDVAAGPGGRLAVVWTGSAGANSRIQARVRTGTAASFSAIENLSALGGNALYPKVAITPNGDTTAIWQRWNGAGNTVQASTRPAGSSSFQPPEDLSGPSQDASRPKIAVARDGRTTIVWQNNVAGKGGLQAATRGSGASSFGNPVDIDTPGSASEPDLAVGPDGTVTVVWVELIGADWIVRSATRKSGTGSFEERNLATAISGAAPQVTTGADGTTVVTWRSPNSAGGGIKAATRRPNTTSFSSPISLSPDNVDAGIGRPAAGPEGTIVVVWSSVDGLVRQVTRLPDPLLGKPVVKGPGSAGHNRKTGFRVRIRNTGFATAKGLVIKVRGKGLRAGIRAGSLLGRKSKAVKVPLRFRKKGKVKVTFTVTTKNAGKKSVRKTVRVR